MRKKQIYTRSKMKPGFQIATGTYAAYVTKAIWKVLGPGFILKWAYTRSKWVYQWAIRQRFLWGLVMGMGMVLGMGFLPSPFSVLKVVEFYIRNEYITRDLDGQQLERGAIEGYLKALNDPYTRYLDPAAHELTQMQVQGSVLGIGIMCRRVENGLRITEVKEEGPAHDVGLQVGDVLVEIEGTDMSTQYRFGDLPQLLEKNSMRLTVLRDKRRFSVVVFRESGPSFAISSTKILDDVGYIRIRSFEPLGLTRELESALLSMRKARCRALVLDLRQNTGGLLRNAVRAAGLFMKEGVVVVTVDRYGTESPMQVEANTAVTAFPVIILVDSRTASAAEVFAAALRDHGIALTVGSPTYGKAAVQKMVSLPDGSALLYTSARYLTPSGRDIHEKGITIDHPLPSTLSESAVLEQAVQLAKTFVRRT